MVGLYMRKLIPAKQSVNPFTTACLFSDSAMALGWDVVLGVGIWRGLIHKFLWTLRLLEHVDSRGLVVFVDVGDSIRTPIPTIRVCKSVGTLHEGLPLGARQKSLSTASHVDALHIAKTSEDLADSELDPNHRTARITIARITNHGRHQASDS